ncbi:hypothetical protein OKA04_02170 [Luteolibacter flavescens]|uniref:ABC transporter permease n=1 Tax=Luteolibacter flavescens TaxID=1859460 RepID=A0ABT3FIW7_9BACT|nr:hypothetical protein [Luteolibacter flavescens]MCW1883515.1 hypothetical protein [Luteolibacter flavescens]
MISRPSWERPLRQRLRKWRKCSVSLRWLRDHAGVLLFFFALSWVLAHGCEVVFGESGGATGVSAVSGLIGALLSASVRSRWEAHGWLVDWTPATPIIAWKLRTREHLPSVVAIVFLSLFMSCSTVGFGIEATAPTALAASVLSMACGFLLAGGRVSSAVLFAAFVLTIAFTLLSGWFGIIQGGHVPAIGQGSRAALAAGLSMGIHYALLAGPCDPLGRADFVDGDFVVRVEVGVGPARRIF